MSILIHGVSIPKDGKVFLIDPWGNVRLYWSKDVLVVGTGLHLCKASELPPHGRLIDADALMAEIRAHDYLLTAMCNSRENGMFTVGIQQAVDEADTIIPAEGGAIE